MGKSKNGGRPVLVTTAHRGVFFGYAEDTDGETIALKRSRLCIYWSVDVKGFMGLAANGPSQSCKIGPAADITLRNITAVLEVTPVAVERWESAPWKWSGSGSGYGYGDGYGSGSGDGSDVVS